MNACPFCAAANREGVLFCEECGSPLSGFDIRVASPNATSQLDTFPEALAHVSPPQGAVLLSQNTQISLHFSRQNETLKLPQQEEVVVGRSDPKSQTFPDLDLTPMGANEEGVSRTHAAIRRKDQTLTLLDLQSANGTFLNGKQIAPNQPHILRDGDEICFGKLVSRIYFK